MVQHKRSKGSGNIYQRAEDSWQLRYPIPRAEDGKRRVGVETVRGARRDAERRLREVIHQQDTGTFVEPSKLSLAQYLSQWIDGH